MFRNIFFNTKTDTIHLWETINGQNILSDIDWVPYVYVKSDTGNIKTIDGKTVERKRFQTYRDYYQYCNDNNNIFENKVRPEIQFLTERYNGINDEDLEVPKLLTYHIDIEINTSVGFPKADEARDPVVLISIKDSITEKTITFGEKPYKGNGTTYIHCKNESELFTKFFKYMHNYPPDVISGWNIYDFDLPYIINRSKRLFGEKSDIFRFISPIKIVRTWKSKKTNALNIDIAGITILDYMQIYKWYSPKNLEKYSLDYVTNNELGEGKLNYSEYEDLREMYNKDWEKYVDYNIRDCDLVYRLEKKLGYIGLIQALSLLTKCPMKYYNAMTQLIEGMMLVYFRRNDLCAPYLAGGTQEYFPAAYVKEPQKGLHDWVIGIDIASSYPSHIIVLNMSIETYVGRIMGIKEESVIYHTRNNNFPTFDMFTDKGFQKFEGKKLENFNKVVDRGLVAIAPCGSVFTTKEPGVIATVERYTYLKRKEVQKRMKEIRDVLPESERVTQLFALQWAIKIILNAVFGITAVPYSRYFNVNIAEAITSCARNTIKQGEKFVNEYMNNFGEFGDLIAYIDTDSLYVKMDEYMGKIVENWNDDDKKIGLIREEAKKIEKYVNARTYRETQLQDYNSQVTDFKVRFEQEIIAKTALFVKKKKYAYWCVDDGGTPKDELKVTGLEIVRSDSSEGVRVRIKHIMEMIMKKEDEVLISQIISKYKKELKDVRPEEIAANIGINNLEKYIKDGRSTKGTPWHVKGVANYRMLLKEYNLQDKYEDIYEGTKAKVVYVKKNMFGIETVSFQRWPNEFDEFIEVDIDTMIEKFFIKKIGFLLDPMNKMELLDVGNTKGALNTFFM